MGINGLLQKLASITQDVTLQDLANLTVGVDAYVWLHKASYSCASELVQNVPTDKYIHYCMKLVRMLQHFNIRPVLVFDGAPLPTKLGKEEERREKREASKKQALEYLLQGNKSAAEECFQRAVNVSPYMAYRLIKVLKEVGVDYIVAPYEADAQLAFLAMNGHVDAVITEDSDLVAYGAPRVIVKMDKFGHGKEIKLSRLGESTELDMKSFTQTNFRHMCILAGCDYVSNVAGIGMVKAFKLVSKHRDPAKIFKALKLDTSIDFPSNYPEYFRRADLTFQHQRVYDPVARKVVPLHPFPPQLEDIPDFIGPPIDDELAVLICTGVVDPATKQPFETTSPQPSLTPSGKLTFMAKPLKNDLTPVQKNTINRYLEKASSPTPPPSTSRKRSSELIAPDTPPEERKSAAKQKIVVKSRFFASKDENSITTANGRLSAVKIQLKQQRDMIYVDADGNDNEKERSLDYEMSRSDQIASLFAEVRAATSIVEESSIIAPLSPFKGPPLKKPRLLDSYYHKPGGSLPNIEFKSPFVKEGRLSLQPPPLVDLTEDTDCDLLEPIASKFRDPPTAVVTPPMRPRERSRSTLLFEALELGEVSPDESPLEKAIDHDGDDQEAREEDIERNLSFVQETDRDEAMDFEKKPELANNYEEESEMKLQQLALVREASFELTKPRVFDTEDEEPVVPRHLDLSRFAFKRSKSIL